MLFPKIAYCLIVVSGILGCSDLMFAQTPTAVPTPQAPTVTTNRIIHLDENSVALYGTVNANGLLTTVWAEYGTNSSSYDNTSLTQSLNGTTTQRVRFDISGLSFDIFGGENFYYRIVAQNSAGTSYGSKEGSGSVIPGFLYGTSITDDATNITTNSVTLNGRCNAISPSRWFEYDTISGEYFYEVAAASCSLDGYCANLSGLSPATTYFYRMAGNDKNYVYYGETKSFTTLNASATPTPTPILTPQAPTVVTGDATVNMDIGTVALNGTVNAHGLTTTAWFQYGTSSGLYSGTSTTQNVEGVDDVVVNLDLSMGDLPIRTGSGYTYYYRIAAQNDAGTSYGNKKSFETGMHGDCFLCSISGYVTDTITKKGIGNAVVSVDSEIKLADINGFYDYADTDASHYTCEGISHTITVSADNYISSTQTFTFDEITCFETLNFELQPICEAEKITIFSRILKIEREQSREVTVTLEGDACIPEGQTVTATVSKAGKGRISISSTSEVTDANGQAVFTITAKKVGNARVVLKTGSLKKMLIVKVK